MNHWMCDDKSPILPLRDLRQMRDGRPSEPKGDHSLVSQKGSNYFLRIDPNRFTFLYFKMAVLPLVPETKMADVGKLITRKPIGQESHVVSVHNYVRNFDFVPRIWSRLCDKDCLYILSSSKNSLSYIATYRNNILSYSDLQRQHTLLHCDLQRQHTLSPSLSNILTSSSQPHENVYLLQPFSFLLCLFG